MKVRYYILITIICFGGIVYYAMNDLPSPWTVGIILFIIGEISFALGMGKMLKRNREYHEKEVWIEDNPDI